MTALGLALGLPFQGPLGGGDLTPQNVQATAGDRQTTLTWDADDNLGYAVYFSRTNNFAGAQVSNLFIPAASVSYDVAASVASDPATSFIHAVGTFYYYWVCGTDGAGNVVTDPSTVVSARPYITVAVSETVNLYVPDGATMNLEDLFFGTVTPPLGLLVNYGPDTYAPVGGGNWEDINTADPANTVPISGAFSLTNNSPGSYTFWNTEP